MRTSLRKGTEMATKKTTTKKADETKSPAKKVTAKKTPAKKTAMETEKNPVDGNVGEAHGKVQLWKDGPYWATTNIGAEKPEDFGYYFWWGDTVGYKRENDKWVAADGSASVCRFDDDYTPTVIDDDDDGDALEEDGWVTSSYVLAPEHDAAHVQWGGEWRMPTHQELDDLVKKCDWTWKKVNGVQGYVVRGKGAYASASVFFPAAGNVFLEVHYSAGSSGCYWSSVPESDSRSAGRLYFDSGDRNTDYYGRCYGQSVRPVQEFTK